MSDQVLYYFKGLEKLGYGTRTTISKRVRLGTFPAPLDDGNGRPIWTDEMLEEHKSSFKQYHPERIKHIKKKRNGEMLVDASV